MSEKDEGEDLRKELLGILRAEAPAKLDKDEKKFNHDFAQSEVKNQKELAHFQGLKDHYALKKGWSSALKWLLIGMIVAQWVLLFLVGCGWFDFTQYKWLLPIVLFQNFGQIIGLAIIVVKSLFKDLNQ